MLFVASAVVFGLFWYQSKLFDCQKGKFVLHVINFMMIFMLQDVVLCIKISAIMNTCIYFYFHVLKQHLR